MSSESFGAKKKSMESQLRLAFLGMGGLTMLVALLGLRTTASLSEHIRELGSNRLPSIDGLWRINEGQTQITAAENAILTPGSPAQERQQQLRRIDGAWKQINSGFKEYEEAEATPEEQRIYSDFKRSWEVWENDHKQLLGAISAVGNAPFPAANTPQGSRIFSLAGQEINSFKQATDDINKVIEYNYQNGIDSAQKGEGDARSAFFWSIVALVAAPGIGLMAAIYFTRTIARPLGSRISEVVSVAENVAAGDLSRNLPHTGDLDELGKLQNSIHEMVRNLNGLVLQIQASGVQITTSTTQIAASGKELEATVAEQLASTNEVTATAQQIAATSMSLVATMDDVKGKAMQTAAAASHSQQDLDQMEKVMRELVSATAAITAKLDVMNEKANNINTVVTTITKVADQTNLLSLNAAIEAEKAGEYGTGFAVVAREIRRLADQTAVATLEIEKMVKEMQSAVSIGVVEMDHFSRTVGRSVDDVVRISDQVEVVIEAVKALTPSFEMVGQSIQEQSQGAQQISEAMQQLSQGSQQTSDALRETNRALDTLDDSTQSMRQEISRFHVAH
ncbi:MAG: methyl-accepting chemotaxis protein [Synechococcaceae cyanobacterium]|nr:methyl-accepting chemotaxis protein [Synechococcaceae cyanobacterium]